MMVSRTMFLPLPKRTIITTNTSRARLVVPSSSPTPSYQRQLHNGNLSTRTRGPTRPLSSSFPPSRFPFRPPSNSQKFSSTPRRTYQYHDPNDPRIRNAKPLVTGAGMRRFARRPSTRFVAIAAVVAAFAFYFSHLETVPVTGRTRFKYYSRDFVRRTAEMQFRAVLYDLERQGARLLPEWDPRTAMVRRVMRKLVPFSGMQDENWEVFVIDDPRTCNAFVLPGGKVFVFSGILRLARSDSALAAVLGHEIAHNLADHIGERMSQGIGTSFLLWSLVVLTAAVGIGPLLAQLFGARFLEVVFERPMSRLQESEADYVGLMMMAEACYDPREAVGFWSRMQRQQDHDVPEWLSTHPSNESRIKKMQEWMPKALEKREQSDCRTTTAFADIFRRALERGIIIGE